MPVTGLLLWTVLSTAMFGVAPRLSCSAVELLWPRCLQCGPPPAESSPWDPPSAQVHPSGSVRSFWSVDPPPLRLTTLIGLLTLSYLLDSIFTIVSHIKTCLFKFVGRINRDHWTSVSNQNDLGVTARQ